MITVLPFGPLAALVEVPRGTSGAWAAAIRSAGVPEGVELVPAARTLLIRAPHRRLLDETLLVLDGLTASSVVATDAPADDTDGAQVVEIAVDYDGDDLEWVAAQVGVDVDEVVRRHTAAAYRVAFVGFAPGFAYLTGLDRSLELPRRPTPRPRVPAGSVAIAAEYAAVYPSASPGGWHLLGRTSARLWDVTREQPALLEPGTHVRFVAT